MQKTSTNQILPLPGAPLIRKVSVFKKYIYAIPCECGRKLTEKNIWEDIAWETGIDEKTQIKYRKLNYRFLCSVCAKRAIRFYEKMLEIITG